MRRRLLKLKRYVRSYSFILASIYASIFCVSIFAVLFYFHQSSYQSRVDQVDQEIEDIISFFDETLIVAELQPRLAVHYIRLAVSEKVNSQTPGDPFVYLLTAQDGRPLAGNLSGLPTIAPDSIDDFRREGRFEFELPAVSQTAGGKPSRVSARAGRLFGSHILLVGRNMSDVDLLERFPAITVWSGLVTIALAMAGSILFSMVVAQRLKKINETCNSVKSGRHDERVETNDSHDAFDQLAHNVNEMLDRVQTHIDDVRSVTDHAVHNVKTPLNHMRIRLERQSREIKPQAGSDNDRLKAVYEQVIAEVDSISDTFNLSLQIANMRTAAGQRSIKEQFSHFDPMALLEDLAETFAPYAQDEKSIQIRISRPPEVCRPIFGHESHIRQALSNLIDNAIKFSAHNSQIRISAVVAETGGLRFVVADQGRGIAAKYHEKVKAVGYRIKTADERVPGNGLGLSFADAVADIHGVRLSFGFAQDSDGERRFEVSVGDFDGSVEAVWQT